MADRVPDLSLCMIVKNEARHLERCLSSVQGLVAEIIVADTGSRDDSRDIARSYGAQVINIPWEEDFAKARNRSLRAATRSWILVLDADEAAGDWEPEALRLLLDSRQADGYFLPFIHYVGGQAEGQYVTDNICRLFRNDERIRFTGSIHEEAASSIWALPGGHIAFAQLPVHHYGYLERELQQKDKANRNLQLIHAALAADPHSGMLRYALGAEYYQLGQYSGAADQLLPLLPGLSPDSGYAADLYLKTAYALQACGRREEAGTVYQSGLSLFPDFTDLLESRAIMLLEEGSLQEPYKLLLQALASGNTAHKYPSSAGSGEERTRLLAGQVCERLFLFPEALEHYGQAVRYKPEHPAAWEALLALSLLAGEQERLTELTRSCRARLPAALLGRLVPAALNARAFGWLAALAAAPQLPAAVRRILVLLPELAGQEDQARRAAAKLERLREERPGQPDISGYLWAWACRAGDRAAEAQRLAELAALRPGLAAVGRLLRAGPEAAGAPPPADLAYAAQLLLQVAAWEALLALAERAPQLRWSGLPQPLWCGLLAAPPGVRQRWCRLTARHAGGKSAGAAPKPSPDRGAQLHDLLRMDASARAPGHLFDDAAASSPILSLTEASQTPSGPAGPCAAAEPPGPAEWLLQAAVAASCGLPAPLPAATERALHSSGSRAARTGLAYRKLQLAAAACPQGLPAGGIPWPLLARHALLEERQLQARSNPK
ncbi:glycosyltransferase family 2 protein [Paenibacillus tengchongensis]|uniref:glycosyltransferase family 2 protein n=1 Tax=Paenibacillus tengchongensis TaxID=2608684 RepID=UPI00124D286C|nr:glycosyltransferase family 2 protein [Paenibacillus tengchongensis]